MYNFVQIYGKELDNKIANADMLLERLIYKNSDYDMLQSEKANERYYAMMNIKNIAEINYLIELKGMKLLFRLKLII